MPSTSDSSPLLFTSFALAEPLLLAVKKMGFEHPTPVQEQAIPPSLAYKDLLVSAKTGSGKTVAFLLPMLQRLLSSRSTLFGTRALILAPTRELARQTYDQCLQLIEFTELKVGLITGGEDFKQHQSLLRRNFEIIIATPGRLLELMNQESGDFSHLEVLVLDEADRMLDMGFSDDVLSIVSHCNAARQTLLFSATLTHFGVIKIADKILTNRKVIALNTLQDEHLQIQQQIILADDNDHKQKLLAWVLLNDEYEKAIIFTNSRLQANALQGPLQGKKLRVGVLHGEMEQKDRNRTMILFREGVINIIIATDLAARGLDVKGINLVVNFDVPRNGIDYIHRIGRTGRVDELGTTITLVKHTEWNLMSSIERFLKQNFIRRTIKELEAKYKGPKKLKASGKAVGSKGKPEPKKAEVVKVKVRLRDKKNVGKRRVPTAKPIVEQVEDKTATDN
ncbi:MAG: DEAD/DEAH box helicase [Methylococcaceae bacterium]|nr:DEAD/DEAH box helicase [Methylococcaceae bacterium]